MKQEAKSEEVVIRPCPHNPTANVPECGFCFTPEEVVAAKHAELTGQPKQAKQPTSEASVPMSEVMQMAAMLAREIVAGLRAPSEEEAKAIARKKRERRELMAEQMESIERKQEMQDACPHMRSDPQGKTHSTITAVHNYPYGEYRGICGICQKEFAHNDPHTTPTEWQQVQISHAVAMQQT